MFRTKYYANGSIQKHKARPVVKDYSQHEVIDHEETFSPIARFETKDVFSTSCSIIYLGLCANLM